MNVTTKTVAEDDRYHVSLDAESRIIRFYLWLYEASPNRINTCKLFWGYVLAPLFLVLRGVFEAGAFVVDLFPKRPEPSLDERLAVIKERSEDRAARLRRRAEQGPGRFEHWLENIGGFLSTAWFKLQKPITWIGIAIGVAIIVGAAGVLIYILVTEPMAFLVGVLLIVGVLAIAFLIMALFTWLDSTGKGAAGMDRFGRTMKACFRAVHDHTCAVVDVKK